MEHRQLGRSGLRVSALCIGTAMFGSQVSERDAFAILDRAVMVKPNPAARHRGKISSSGSGVDGVEDVPAGEAAVVEAGPGLAPDLGGQHDGVPGPPGEPGADDLLRQARPDGELSDDDLEFCDAAWYRLPRRAGGG